MVEYVSGMLTFANFLIATFVLIFAMSFLKKTKDVKDRKPWVFLLIAVVVFFIMQFVNILGLAGFFTLDTYRSYFDSMFLAIILFTFVFQYNLILNSELILISRKNADVKVKAVEMKTKKVSVSSKKVVNKATKAKKKR